MNLTNKDLTNKFSQFKFLNNLRDFVYQEAKDKGWHTEDQIVDINNISKYILNLIGECSELWEAARKGNLDQLCDKAESMKDYGLTPLTCAAEELADVVIRALDTAKALNIDIAEAVYNKILFNRTRAFRHGNKLA